MTHDVWPKFNVSPAPKSNVPCPYILSKQLLGTGSYANVYECKNKITGKHYAAKRFDKKLMYGNELMLQREFRVLKSILRGHPNILLIKDHFETSDYFFLVTNLAVGGELFERITGSPDGKLTVSETSKILAVLLSAISHLHSNRIVHRDIKAENILFASKNSKISLLLLADFGQARILRPGETAQTVEGTLSYIAPEALARKGHSFPVDMWAVGVLCYFMLCGFMPFDCDSDSETKELISKADFVFEPEEYWVDIPESAKDFLAQCFKLDPEERITASDALKHPFLTVASSLKPAFSHNSLQKLHDAVSKLLHSQQQLSPSKLVRQPSFPNFLTKQHSSANLRHNASTRSFEDLRHALHGEKCHSPNTVTTFTTPVASALVSRRSSAVGLESVIKGFLPANHTPQLAGPKAEFTL